MTIKRYLLSTSILVMSIFSNSSTGLQYQITTTATLEHSNNAARLTNNRERSDTERRAEAGFDLEHITQQLQATARYRAQHSDYEKNVLDDETFFEGQTNVRWSPLSPTLNWDFFTSTRNLQRDSREIDTLNTREKRNIVSTGPVLGARISSVDTLQLAGRYTKIMLEESDQSDNDRIMGQLNWIHKLSPTREFIAGVEHTKTDFAENNLIDIENYSTYVSFSSALSNAQVRLKAGYNESKRDAQNDVGGPLVELAINYTLTSHNISFVAINLITDSTIGLGSNPILIDEDIQVDDANFTDIDIVERTFSELRYSSNILCASCTLAATIAYDKQEFEVLPRDEVSLNVELGLQYQVNSSLSIGSFLSHTATEYKNSNRDDDLQNIRVRADYAATRSITVFALLSAEQRQSNNREFEYDEIRGNIGIRYQF